MLGVPVTGMTVGDLASQNLVQGVTGQYPTAQSNLFVGYNGNNSDNTDGRRNGFIPAADASEGLTPGRGFIWYAYDQDIPAASGGTSRSYALPHTLSGTGAEASDDWALPFQSRVLGSADGFYLIANPFELPLDLSGVSAGGVGLGSLQNVFQIWNPNSGQTTDQGNGTPGSYVTVNRLSALAETSGNDESDDIAPWQGAFAEINALLGTNLITTFYFDRDDIVSGTPQVYGRTASAQTGEASQIAVLRLRLGGETEDRGAVFDEAIAIAFTDVSSENWDTYDATKLPSIDSPAWMAPLGEGRYGTMVEKAQEALPLDLSRSITVPLSLTTHTAGTFELSWSGLGELPESWALTLTDTETGALVDLRQETTLTFDVPATENGVRFNLTVDPSLSTSTGAVPQPDGFALSPLSPNPATGAARTTLQVESDQSVTADLYDVLGRHVALVFEAPLRAGAAVDLQVGSDALAPGVYVLRVAGETFVTTRQMTITR